MGKYVWLVSKQQRGLAMKLCAALFAMLPAQVLTAGHPLEDRPAPPPTAEHVGVMDNNGNRRFIVQIPAEVLFARGKVDAVWIERRRRDLRLRNINRRSGEPLMAYDFGRTLADVLEPTLNPASGRATASSDNRDHLAANDAARGIHGHSGKASRLGGNEKTDGGHGSDQQRDNQIQPLQHEPRAADSIGGRSLAGGEPLGAKITVALVFWALTTGLIPFMLIWFGLARTFRGQAVGAGLTVGCSLTSIVTFSYFWTH